MNHDLLITKRDVYVKCQILDEIMSTPLPLMVLNKFSQITQNCFQSSFS